MKSSYIPEMDANSSEELEKIMQALDSEISNMALPSWVCQGKCPFCECSFTPRSIRNIGLCLNARNIGDIKVEILCDNCKQMETLYFRENIENIKEFCDFISGVRRPITQSLTEENMYRAQYNNVLERTLSKRK